MKYRTLFTIFLWCFWVSPQLAFCSEKPATKLDECNTLYHEHQFEGAIACYEQLLSDQYSAALLYNIGNSYAQLDQPGHSILNYLRAQMLSPSDSDISGNLELVREAYGLFSPEPSFIKEVLKLLSLAQWSFLCLLALGVYLLYSAAGIKGKRTLLKETVVVLLCLCLFSVGAFASFMNYRAWHRGVVVSDTTLRISPFEGGASVGSIKAGRLASPHKNHGDYWFVTDETGRQGWIDGDFFIQLLPH